MNITPSQLSVIQQKASTLIERYGSALIRGEIPDALPIHQLWEWDQRLSGPSTSPLLQRLSLYRHVKPQIAEAQQKYERETQDQSGWIASFREVLKFYPTEIPHSACIEIRGAKPIAFETLLFPFVSYALKSLMGESGIPEDLCTKNAIRAHSGSLLKLLSGTSAACFYESFSTYRKARRYDQTEFTDTRLYQQFEASMYSGGIVEFFEEYSALARLLMTLIQQWVVSTQVLFARLQKDIQILSETFFKNLPPGRVKNIRSGLTALHSNEGQVFELTFARGKLLYKPRSAVTDLALSEIFSWLNASRVLIPMQSVQVVDRDTYSWHEYIGWQTCAHQKKAEQYYTRIGQQAAVLQLLGSNDYHFDNLRAHGEDPYLIDNETLLSPVLKIRKDHTLTRDAVLDEGVAFTLSRGLFLLDTLKLFYPRPRSISGVFENTDRDHIIRYRHANTDAMFPVKEYQKRTGKNIPGIGGKLIQPGDYVSWIRKGYLTTLELIAAKKDEFSHIVRSATRDFAIEVRMLVRATPLYQQILLQSLLPEYLRDGVGRSLLFERLAPFYISSHTPHESGRFLIDETEMLQDHLVPWFHTKANDQTWLPKAKYPTMIKKCAQQVFEERIHRLDTNFVDLQAKAFNHYLGKPSGISLSPDIIPEEIHSHSGKGALTLFTNACTIAHHLQFCYRHFYPINALNSILGEADITLIEHYAFSKGLLGVLVTLAYFDPYLPDSCIDTIHTLLEPLKRYAQNSGTSAVDTGMSDNGIRSLGSVIYGLCTLTTALRDETFVTTAFQLAEKGFTLSSGRSSNHTLNEGMAGSVLGLAKLYMLRPHPTFKRIIDEYTHQLLLNSTLHTDTGHLQKPGYYEGHTGILHACCIAYQVTRDSTLLEKIESLYHGLEGYWAEALEHFVGAIPGKGRFRNSESISLSDGLAGWLLVRIKAQQILYDMSPESHIVEASKKLLFARARDTDYISTGLAGRCEPALMLADHTASELDILIDTWNQRYAKHRVFDLTPNFLSPHFNEGIAGILYQQLRLLFRKEMPSLISYE